MTPRLTNPHSWYRVGLGLGQIFLASHILHHYIGGVGSTVGISMVPIIPARNSWILYSALHRRGRGVKVGDVITYTHPMFPNQYGCKRIIGMPGDFVSVVTPGRRDGDFGVEDVEDKWATVKEQVIQVPEGHCWLAGDNLEWSRDSRLFGPVPLGLVKAKVLAVVHPFGDAKWLGAQYDVKEAQEKKHEWVITR
ncbi:peptidase S24/S26A/S26B/S26C [Ampelomyces quisqualis]|uniref:Mitochondrial inner membrane protease subunit n=1 Tax=Ampelomyces quisqualis TaxID=50730 RepID=A0A6A5QV36_AMPQU|nr:peptidase S24/S26A/S26B/S26C [Ampelomyces quisqualis]